MKSNEPTPSELKLVTELKANTIGSSEDRKNREKALNCLDKAKEQESERIASSWRWMFKEKTSKLVAPEKQGEARLEGYMFCITKK